MEVVSRFAEGSFKKKTVASGKKVIASSRPELILNPTKDSFSLNSKATSMMGLVAKDRVVMIDLGADAADINSRFFICPSYKKDGVEMGALLATTAETVTAGAKLNYSYSGIWAAQLLCAKTASKETEVSKNDLVGNGLVKVSKTEKGKESVSSLIRLRFLVESVGTQVVDEDANGNDITAHVYALTAVESDDLTKVVAE